MIQPPFDGFAAGYAQGRPQLLYTRLVADLETPVSAFLKLGEDGSATMPSCWKACRAARRAAAIPSSA